MYWLILFCIFFCIARSVMDLLRFHKFTIGHAWMSEYGNPEEEKHFHNLIVLSPLHNVPDANSITRFPATLLLTGDYYLIVWAIYSPWIAPMCIIWSIIWLSLLFSFYVWPRVSWSRWSSCTVALVQIDCTAAAQTWRKIGSRHTDYGAHRHQVWSWFWQAHRKDCKFSFYIYIHSIIIIFWLPQLTYLFLLYRYFHLPLTLYTDRRVCRYL